MKETYEELENHVDYYQSENERLTTELHETKEKYNNLYAKSLLEENDSNVLEEKDQKIKTLEEELFILIDVNKKIKEKKDNEVDALTIQLDYYMKELNKRDEKEINMETLLEKALDAYHQQPNALSQIINDDKLISNDEEDDEKSDYSSLSGINFNEITHPKSSDRFFLESVEKNDESQNKYEELKKENATLLQERDDNDKKKVVLIKENEQLKNEKKNLHEKLKKKKEPALYDQALQKYGEKNIEQAKTSLINSIKSPNETYENKSKSCQLYSEIAREKNDIEKAFSFISYSIAFDNNPINEKINTRKIIMTRIMNYDNYDILRSIAFALGSRYNNIPKEINKGAIQAFFSGSGCKVKFKNKGGTFIPTCGKQNKDKSNETKLDFSSIKNSTIPKKTFLETVFKTEAKSSNKIPIDQPYKNIPLSFLFKNIDGFINDFLHVEQNGDKNKM